MATSSSYNSWITSETMVGLKVTNSAPLDRRFVIDSMTSLSTVIPKSYRYPGLRFYVLAEEKEYWFKGGVNKSDLVEYHPEAMFVVAEDAVEDIDTTKLAVGSEITVFDNEGNPTKYVWNGTTWKPLIRETGSATITPIITNVATDTYEELEAIINNHIQANGITATKGTELGVVFVDTAEEDKNADTYNKYVYLDTGDGTDHWYQVSGTQVFRFTIPNEILEAEAGTEMLAGESNTAGKYVKFVRGADKRLDIVISHNFCSQFVDASYYQVGIEPADRDFDDILDSDWGEQVFIPANNVKSNGEYKHVLTFFSYDSGDGQGAEEANMGDEFIVVIQR